ncbi:Mitochondrial carrier homolog 2 [Strongyloides ratti]|uniref:Mitochondrial carrier homolog 2 n=1 Tax=Strongyloides ratti TaxID=34506 RepID=A0A090LNE0_STRRB|nr:Mitochondrial carrier homolog 2 [Strongyloides ratti]CEF69050.1 Mitochondrial carrier homolog 2 [Strongyloides ratti]
MADNAPVVNEEIQLGNLKTSIVKSLARIPLYPINVAKILMQLGYEPFPCEEGRVFYVLGRSAFFLPNGFKYIRELAKREGFGTLFRGLDCYILFNITNEFVRKEINNYLDIEYPTFGGYQHVNADDFTKLNDKEALAVTFRNFVRDLVSSNAATLVSRPFCVLFVRQVAQIIGHENKYTNVFRDICIIGNEEGLKGLFSGLTAAIVGTSVVVLVHHTCSFIIERSLLRVPRNEDETEEENIAKIKKSKHFIEHAIQFVSNYWSYPYQLVSSIMAVTGSQLFCSLMPYTPTYNHYEDLFDYLKNNGSINRGNKLFFREYKGPIEVDINRKIYADNKYFS